MTDYQPRSAWTSTPAAGADLPDAEVVGHTVHWPGARRPIGDPGPAAIAATLEGYRRDHVTGNGWDDLAYQVAFDQAGRVWELRGIERRSAANGDATQNRRWGAVLFLVGPGEQPSPALLAAYRDWRATRWLPRYPSAVRVAGHRDVRPDPTECPGPLVYALVRSGALTTPQEDDMPTPGELLNAPIPRRRPDGSIDETRPTSLALEVGYLSTNLGRILDAVSGLSAAIDARDAQAIAAAIPDDLADQVVDALAARLKGA